MLERKKPHDHWAPKEVARLLPVSFLFLTKPDMGVVGCARVGPWGPPRTRRGMLPILGPPTVPLRLTEINLRAPHVRVAGPCLVAARGTPPLGGAWWWVLGSDGWRVARVAVCTINGGKVWHVSKWCTYTCGSGLDEREVYSVCSMCGTIRLK